jgi:hypothetical protein
MMVDEPWREIVTFALHSVRDEKIHYVQIYGFWSKRRGLLTAVGVVGKYGKPIMAPSPKTFN